MTKVPKEVDNLCIKVGSFIEYWGFKEIEGRIWCHLLLSNRALCPQDLMQLTGVSKGLVSISLTRLLDYNVVRIEHKRGRRTQYYQVNENVIDVIRGVLISRESKLLESIEQSAMTLKKLPKGQTSELSLERAEFLLKFVKTASHFLNVLLYGGEKISRLVFDKAPIIRNEH
jgi:DNA-binding transcriptional regulator GbsR (MarR family)